MITGLHHVGIAVGDLERSIDFYGNVLGLEVGERWEFERGAALGPGMPLPRKVAFIKVDGSSFELLDNAENTEARPEGLTGTTIGIHHLAFSVDGICGYAAALEKKGIRFSTGPVEVKDLTVAFFRDPDGNLLELCQKTKHS